MKKILKWGLIGLVVLIVIGAVSSAGKGGSSNQSTTSVSTPTSAPTAVQAEKIDTKALINDFDKNQLSAVDKYKGKLLEFSAKVKNISKDITGSPFLSLEPASADQYYFGTTLQCFFKNADDLKSLENGKTYTLRGTNDGMSIGIIVFKDCEVVK